MKLLFLLQAALSNAFGIVKNGVADPKNAYRIRFGLSVPVADSDAVTAAVGLWMDNLASTTTLLKNVNVEVIINPHTPDTIPYDVSDLVDQNVVALIGPGVDDDLVTAGATNFLEDARKWKVPLCDASSYSWEYSGPNYPLFLKTGRCAVTHARLLCDSIEADTNTTMFFQNMEYYNDVRYEMDKQCPTPRTTIKINSESDIQVALPGLKNSKALFVLMDKEYTRLVDRYVAQQKFDLNLVSVDIQGQKLSKKWRAIEMKPVGPAANTFLQKYDDLNINTTVSATKLAGYATCVDVLLRLYDQYYYKKNLKDVSLTGGLVVDYLPAVEVDFVVDTPLGKSVFDAGLVFVGNYTA